MACANMERAGLAVTLALTGVPASVGIMCLSPVLPLIEQQYAAFPSMMALVKYISVSIGIGMVLGAPLAGVISDRLGRRAVLLFAVLIFCLCGTIGYLVSNLYALIVLRMSVGAAASSILAVGIALIGDLFDDQQRDRIIGINATCSSLVAIMTVPLSGFLGDISPKLPFLLHIIPLPILFLAILFIPRRPVERDSGNHAHPKLGRTHLQMMVYALTAGVVIFAIPVFLPFFMRNAGITSAFDNSLVLTTQSICAAAFATIYGWARQRMSIGGTFAISFGLYVLGCIIMLSFSDLWSFYISAVLLGLGMAWVAPSLMSSASILSAPQNRGRVIGLVKGLNLSGSFFAVFLIDPIYRSHGADMATMLLLIIAAAMAAIGTLRFRKLGTSAG